MYNLSNRIDVQKIVSGKLSNNNIIAGKLILLGKTIVQQAKQESPYSKIAQTNNNMVQSHNEGVDLGDLFSNAMCTDELNVKYFEILQLEGILRYRSREQSRKSFTKLDLEMLVGVYRGDIQKFDLDRGLLYSQFQFCSFKLQFQTGLVLSLCAMDLQTYQMFVQALENFLEWKKERSMNSNTNLQIIKNNNNSSNLNQSNRQTIDSQDSSYTWNKQSSCLDDLSPTRQSLMVPQFPEKININGTNQPRFTPYGQITWNSLAQKVINKQPLQNQHPNINRSTYLSPQVDWQNISNTQININVKLAQILKQQFVEDISSYHLYGQQHTRSNSAYQNQLNQVQLNQVHNRNTQQKWPTVKQSQQIDFSDTTKGGHSSAYMSEQGSSQRMLHTQNSARQQNLAVNGRDRRSFPKSQFRRNDVEIGCYDSETS